MKRNTIWRIVCAVLTVMLAAVPFCNTIAATVGTGTGTKLINTGELVLDTDAEDGYTGEYVVIYNPSTSSSNRLSTGNMSGLIEEHIDASAGSNDTKESEDLDLYIRDVDSEMPFLPLDVDKMPSGEKTSYQLGDLKNFSIAAYSPGSGNMQFRCIGVGENCYIWTPNENNPNYHPLDQIDPTYGEIVAAEFDAKYALMNSSFGNHDPGNQGDGKVHLMYYNIDCGWTLGQSYVAGYFSSSDYYSNGLPMIHLDTYPGVQYTNANGEVITRLDRVFGVQSHEYQHLINYSRTGGMDTWLNESMSAAAEEICYPGSSINGRIESWMNYDFDENEDYLDPPAEHEYTPNYYMHNGASMYFWQQSINDVLALYAQVSLFSQYMFTHYGNSIFSNIISRYQGDAASAITLATGDNVSDIVRNFRIALTANDPNNFDGLYGFDLQEGYNPEDYHGVPNLYNWLSPIVFTGTNCDIAGGGAITVRPIDGEYYPPEGASNGLEYIGISFTSEPPTPVPLTDFSFNPSTIETYTGATLKVRFVRVPDNANNYSLAWSVADTSVARVSGNNRIATITGVREGTTTLTCVATSLLDATTITRSVPVTVLGLPTLQDALNASGGNLTFTTSSDYPFEVEVISDAGRVAGVSGNQDVSSTTSSITTTINAHEGDTISFDWSVSSESGWDKLFFTVNGSNAVDPISGNVDWRTVTYTIPSDGEYTLSWKYTKDGSISSGSDCGWVDEILFTPLNAQMYTVTFVDGVTGGVIETVEVNEGAIVTTFPTPAQHDGYVFVGWDYENAPITANTTITSIYRLITTVPGDVNGDGVVLAGDALLALRAAIGSIVLDDYEFDAADINGDGLITAADALMILRMVLE